MADSDSYTSLIEHYGLPKECLTKQVSPKHRAEIAQYGYCKEWRKLPAHLEMMSVVVDDIDRCSVEEDEKRRKFMSQWNSKKGSEATYKKLICALLKFGCKDNAESVCELLQGNARLLQSPDEQVKPVNSTFPTGKLCGMTLSVSALCHFQRNLYFTLLISYLLLQSLTHWKLIHQEVRQKTQQVIWIKETQT